MTPRPIECVEGCGGDPVLAVASIVIAAASIGVALVALYTTRRMFRMAKTEHELFMQQAGARADFDLEVWITHHNPIDGVIETEADGIGVVLQLGITNIGNKAASNVGVNLLAPTSPYVREFEWVTQAGHPLGERDRAAGPLSTAEELVAEDGSRHPAHYLTRTYETVGLKGALVAFARLDFALPQRAGTTEIVVPIKFKVWSDDLPEGVDDRTKQIEFRLRRTLR